MSTRVDHLPAQASNKKADPPRLTILLFSGDFDKITAALTVATSAAVAGMQVSVFFSFWGLAALRKKHLYRGKSFIARLMTAVMPDGATLPTSRLNFCGAGPRFFGYLMREKNIPGPAELLALASELGVELVVCPTSMEMMGISAEELMPGIQFGGATSFVCRASQSAISLVF